MVRGDRETTSGWEFIWRQDHLRGGIFKALDTKDARATVEVPAHRGKYHREICLPLTGRIIEVDPADH